MSGHTVVVGTDGSVNAARAVQVAARLAGDDGRLVLVHVFEPLAHLSEMGSGSDFASLEEEAATSLDGEWSEPAREEGVDPDTRIVHGSPAEALLDVADAESADFLVIGARGLGRLKSLMLGSVSSKVVQTSTRPVVVVPSVD